MMRVTEAYPLQIITDFFYILECCPFAVFVMENLTQRTNQSGKFFRR